MNDTVELQKEPTNGVTVRPQRGRSERPSVLSRTTDALGRAVDSIIGIFSPEVAVRRATARSLYRGYDAAQASRLSANRRTSLKDADSELNGKLGRIRSFSRDECRNNGFARGAKRAHKNNVIGDADTGQGVTVDPAVLNADGTPAEDVNKEIAALWECYRDKLDLRGFWGFTDLCSIADHELFEAGEVLGIFHDVGSIGSDLPFSVEMVEPDRLPTTNETMGLGPFGKYPVVNADGKPGENWVRHGIEYEELGRRVAYHVMIDHPGNEYAFASVLRTRRYPIERIFHYFSPDRAEQTRGVSGLIAALSDLADAQDLKSFTLTQAKIQACFGVHFKGSGLTMPATTSDGTPASTITDAAGNPVTEMQPGMVTQGQGDAQMISPSTPGSTFDPFMKLVLRGISAATGIGYSTLARDYTGGSFSSLRQEGLEDRNTYRCEQGLHLRHFIRPLWVRFVKALVVSGKIKTFTQKDFAKDPARFTRANIQFRGWEYVNPLQEAMAEAVQLAQGMKTLDEVANTSGTEPADRLKSLAAYKKLAEGLGLTMPWMYGVAKPAPNGGATAKAEETKLDDATSALVDSDKSAEAGNV